MSAYFVDTIDGKSASSVIPYRIPENPHGQSVLTFYSKAKDSFIYNTKQYLQQLKCIVSLRILTLSLPTYYQFLKLSFLHFYDSRLENWCKIIRYPLVDFCYFSLAFCLQIDGNCKEKFSLATDENETFKLWQLSLRQACLNRMATPTATTSLHLS